ncbi:MATE family efflux transporter [Salinimonas sp. HHU 13199]|uniref:MATE family efflux transporter n=2 Tax=Salinimonas profundi TaxID=2729140 RepID=A0ABR8LMV1_9ALTE|nr:MATE family efflux transporter [Salinimonas profundi]
MLTLATPMILANVTTPLLGLVDTAVMGHMDSPAMLAGASIGALILTQIYWVCGFLRMSATGLSAQARGQDDNVTASAKVFYQSSAMALILGVLVFALQYPVLNAGIYLAGASEQVSQYIDAYFSVRVWGAPAAMLNLALIGWLVGQQKTRAVMAIQIIGNLLNAGLDFFFVLGLDMSVQGVALASVFAEYTMALLAAGVALKMCGEVHPHAQWFNKAARRILFKLNGDMLLRNLALQLCLAFLTLQGARYGETAAAVNAILMQFFVLIALGLDGIAYAVEALVGEAAGKKQRAQVIRQTWRGLLWSSVFAVLYAIGFWLFGSNIIGLLTDLPALFNAALPYLPLMIWLPLVGHWCFLFDGVFVGLTRSAAMRDTMIFSAAVVFFPLWWVLKDNGNEALWYALLGFLLARGVTLGGLLIWLNRRRHVIAS